MAKFFTPTTLSENMHETPEGFLICVGVNIARTGEQVYGEGETPIEPDEDGTVIITRDPEDVFHVRAIASFEGKPVTINHPEDFVDPNNWSYLAKGSIQNVRKGSGESAGYLVADVLITDAMAISMVKTGLREVSCGYEAEYIQTGKGKGKQTRIIGNHLALVEKGRAGPTCAINDHEGKVKTTMSKIADMLKKLSKVADEEMEKKDEPKKDDKKDESKDAGAYDELVKMVKDLSDKIEAMGGKKDEPKDEKPSEEKKDDEKKPEDEKKDDEKPSEEKKPDEEKPKDEDGEKSMEERLKTLETAVSKLLEMKAGDEDKEEESEDDDFEESTMTGDTASRAEILSPGIKASKDIKAKALKAAYDTTEGKQVIDSLTGGKPTFDSAEKVETLFIAASELLKVKRSGALSETKKTKDFAQGSGTKGFMTPEQMNELNAAHWAKK